jgi:peptidoglycan/xylan/chitin deacetylase (PgdA/CDA1 family)
VPAEPPSTTTPVAVDTYPMIRHWEQPRVDNTVALTFDDGPNPATTNRILDTLKTEGIRATFFINTRATLDLRTSSEAKLTLARIIAEGHVLGNHTANHYDLAKTSTDVDGQLRAVEDDLKAIAPCAPRLTLVRAPFGSPYLSGTEEEQARVFPLIAKHGVHVGWSIESIDYECANAACVVERIIRRIDLGRRGPILMHDTQAQTADALPTLIAELRSRGVTFVTAEKLVRDKYGKTSAELVK